MGASNAQTNGTATEPAAHRALPDEKTLLQAKDLMVVDESGEKLAFGSLLANPSQPNERQIVIFIRHFFCGLCEEYVRALGAAFPPSKLAAATPPTRLVIIGSGEPACVPSYKQRTGCPYEIYCDASPKQALYRTLGMSSNLGYGGKTEYMSRSMFRIVARSFVTALTAGSQVTKGGPSSQNGGEWVFEGGELKWCHRMRNTADHTEVSELKKVLAIE